MTHRHLPLILAALLASAPARAPTPPPAPAEQPDTPEAARVWPFHDNGVLLMQTADGDFKWWLDGRVNLDAAYYFNSDNTLANGMELRRGRIALNMQLWKDWAGQFDVNYADNVVDVKDAWIGYTGLSHSLVRVGNFRTPFGLETLTSSRFITFMERALTDNFSPDRRIGVGINHWHDRWQAAAGVFGPELEDSVDTIGQSQTHSIVGRVTALPIARGTTIVHLGVAAANMEPNAPTDESLSDANRWRVRARPETDVNRGRFLNTGQVRNVDHASLYGLEAASTFGPLSFQAEYNYEKLRRTSDGLPEPTYSGYYGFVSYFVTGEHRPYDRTVGEFGRIVPRSRRGALELAARYSSMDLNDASADVFGGREDIVTLAANWYANANVRIMANYLFVKNDEHATGDRDYTPSDRFNVVQMRLALMF
jgi:phosphate-selective porin OprO/OprP